MKCEAENEQNKLLTLRGVTELLSEIWKKMDFKKNKTFNFVE